MKIKTAWLELYEDEAEWLQVQIERIRHQTFDDSKHEQKRAFYSEHLAHKMNNLMLLYSTKRPPRPQSDDRKEGSRGA